MDALLAKLEHAYRSLGGDENGDGADTRKAYGDPECPQS